MILRRRKNRLAELDEAVASAEAERLRSVQRLHVMRETVVKPIIASGYGNHWADRIRASLHEGQE